jgi:hypothetical protein
MRSLCRNCAQFGKCGFVAYFPMSVPKCPDYKRGSVNHGQDVYMEVEVKRGRPAKGEFTSAQTKVAKRGRPKKNVEVAPVTIESRVRKILADFPTDFRANDLKSAYQEKYNSPLKFTKDLREKVCTPWKYGSLINKCKVKRRRKVVSV